VTIMPSGFSTSSNSSDDDGEPLCTPAELALWTHLHCKCGHTIDAHRDGFKWNWRYNRGHCLECECCVYRPNRIVNR
jgi:hypothetical protein